MFYTVAQMKTGVEEGEQMVPGLDECERSFRAMTFIGVRRRRNQSREQSWHQSPMKMDLYSAGTWNLVHSVLLLVKCGKTYGRRYSTCTVRRVYLK